MSSLRWCQVLTLFNPLTYVSAGMRGTFTSAPHLGAGWIVLGVEISGTGFLRRAVD